MKFNAHHVRIHNVGSGKHQRGLDNFEDEAHSSSQHRPGPSNYGSRRAVSLASPNTNCIVATVRAGSGRNDMLPIRVGRGLQTRKQLTHARRQSIEYAYCNSLNQALWGVPKNFNGCACFAIEDVDGAMIASAYDDLSIFAKYYLFADPSGGRAGGKVAKTFDSVCAMKAKPISNVVDSDEVAPVIASGPTATVRQYHSDEINFIAIHALIGDCLVSCSNSRHASR